MSFRIYSKRLMKWREPKVKGMVTLKNILTALILILIISIPFGFLGGNGKFSVSVYFLALGFMSVGVVGLLIQPLLPGTQIQLREDAIVRVWPRRNQRSAYKDIDCCYFYRDCSYSKIDGSYVMKPQERSVEGPNFTFVKVIMKNEKPLNAARVFVRGMFSRSVGNFDVPDDVNLDQVLQILRDKGVKVTEGPLPQ